MLHKILLQCLHDLRSHILLLVLGHLLSALHLSILLILTFRNTLQSVTQHTGLHPGQLEESLAVVEVGVSALVSRLPVLLGHELTGQSKAAHSLGKLTAQVVPLSLEQVLHGFAAD